jgi:glycosyltransferase involved in cell wall biosynthesis
MPDVPDRILALGSTTAKNRIGRAFSLWLTAQAAGVDFTYVCVDDGPVWEPLRDHDEFLRDVVALADLGAVAARVRAELRPDTTLLVCKPRPELLRLARAVADPRRVVVDIDDPELLDPWGATSLIVRAKRVVRFGPAPFRFGWARRVVQTMNVITSNPLLQAMYGGIVVPHVRDVADPPVPRARTGEPFTIGFVGTPRDHKGLDLIRAAVAELARTRTVRLCVTAPEPLEVCAWEEWLGETSLAEGRKLLARCDAVAIVSRPGVWGDLQLPVKLIDALAAGVPAVITARPPLLWAAGGAAMVVRDDTVDDLRDAFALLADDPKLAHALAAAAWQRARTVFTPTAAATPLARAMQRLET